MPSDSPAVRAAAVAVRKELLRVAGEELEAPPEELTLAAGEVIRRGEPEKKVAVSALTGLRSRGVLVGVGTRGPNPKGKIANPFAAHFAEVEVNVRTGELAVLRVVAAQDSGRVMNRLTFDNQVFGGVTMGIGFAATEARVLDRQTGTMANANWHDYRIPTMMDVPTEMECVPVDPHDTECNTTGAKGLGEPATIPTAAAIANAVYDAIGVRVSEAPITPERLVQILGLRKEG